MRHQLSSQNPRDRSALHSYIMAERAVKKRRTTEVIDLSDDLGSSSPPPIPAKRTNSRRVVSGSVASSSKPATTSRRAASTSTTTKSSNPKASISKKKPPTSSSSSTEPKKPRRPTAKKKGALLALFGTRDPEDLKTPLQRASTPSASNGEDVDDLIEDAISDDDGIEPASSTVPPPKKTKKQATLATHLTVSKPFGGIQQKSGHLSAIKAPPKFSSSQIVGVKPVANAPADMRPWAEKYAPKDTTEVAGNKVKITAVRNWLQRVFDGLSRQRLLVITGSAGAGKTATVEALAKEMKFEIVEWRNPSSATGGEEYGEEGAFAAGLTGLFEEFVGRAGNYGSLDMVSSSATVHTPKSTQQSLPSSTNISESGKKKVIVIEDFPNTLFSTSKAPLQSFQRAIKSFLALPPPPPGAPALPPLVMIITETSNVAGPDSFTAYRLLSPEVLSHTLTHSIEYNKIAPTFMVKALYSIIRQESKYSGRQFGPSKQVLDALSTSGDIRSAIMGLEFLSMGGNAAGFSEPIVTVKQRARKKSDERDLTTDELRLLESVQQRESSFGIFHAVGKVIYNKRFGDDLGDPYMPEQIRPLLDHLPYHERPTRIDPNTFSDETGTDPRTFVSAIHENYLGSCNLLGGLGRNYGTEEDVLDTVIGCLDAFSDADLLSPSFTYSGHIDTSSASIRADEFAFQTAVRGTMLALPSPVKRDHRKGLPREAGAKMYYPTSERLWRGRRDIDEIATWFTDQRQGKVGMCAGGKKEAIVETMPYMALIERRRDWARRQPKGTTNFFKARGQRESPELDKPMKTALEKVTTFKGVGIPSEEVDEDEDKQEAKVPTTGTWKKKETVDWADDNGDPTGNVPVESLVLSDDDIEEF
ncbi:Rad17 cell cycle checkpoint protein-domain-containing protein [Geopyxis carbonaria]|nr:Rad17 cell cycle checkpoint protein-domain-containing protein [Geopyxis carbonaria]